MALPKVVYVYEDKGTDDVPYLVASMDSHELDEGIIGIYDLREKIHVRHQPQFRRPKTKTWFNK